jgi:hypothetical protein
MGQVTVKVFSCGDDAETEMNWVGMAQVAGADVGSGVVGALVASPTGPGAVYSGFQGALIGSGGTVGLKLVNRLIDRPEK